MNDIIFTLGVLAIWLGCVMISVPLGLIVLGVVLMLSALAREYAKRN